MLSITFVVAILFIAMMTQSISVEKQLSQYQQELEELDNKMTEETERTKEIDDMKEYMETDEYAEEVARDKLGLVKDNEIIQEFDGELPFDDKADPKIIQREFGLSKNAFKRAVGHLLKENKIEIKNGKISIR